MVILFTENKKIEEWQTSERESGILGRSGGVHLCEKKNIRACVSKCRYIGKYSVGRIYKLSSHCLHVSVK